MTPERPRRATVLLFAAASAVLAAGFGLRWPVALYHGAADQWALNDVLFAHPGAYSDIASLYFRDALWRHPAPYFVRPVEYPVLLGALIWLINAVARALVPYVVATGLVMAASGLATLNLLRRFREANPWLLALSPALALYVLLNWDMAAMLPMVLALWLYREGRDRVATVALSVAVWIKFFPLLVLPIVLTDRLVRRRYRDIGWIGGIFAVASVLINAPFAFARSPATGALGLRASWTLFFRYNRERGPEVNLWNVFDALHPTVAQINTGSGVLMVAGTLGACALVARAAKTSGGRDPVPLGAAALLAWFFFVNKVYSPQYSLWLATLIAMLGAPAPFAVAFAWADVVYFVAIFAYLHLAAARDPNTDWFWGQVLFPSMIARELLTLGFIAWIARALLTRPTTSPPPTARSSPAAAPA